MSNQNSNRSRRVRQQYNKPLPTMPSKPLPNPKNQALQNTNNPSALSPIGNTKTKTTNSGTKYKITSKKEQKQAKNKQKRQNKEKPSQVTRKKPADTELKVAANDSPNSSSVYKPLKPISGWDLAKLLETMAKHGSMPKPTIDSQTLDLAKRRDMAQASVNSTLEPTQQLPKREESTKFMQTTQAFQKAYKNTPKYNAKNDLTEAMRQTALAGVNVWRQARDANAVLIDAGLESWAIAHAQGLAAAEIEHQNLTEAAADLENAYKETKPATEALLNHAAHFGYKDRANLLASARSINGLKDVTFHEIVAKVRGNLVGDDINKIVAYAIQGWQDSRKGHNANLRHKENTHIGIGAYKDANGDYHVVAALARDDVYQFQGLVTDNSWMSEL